MVIEEPHPLTVEKMQSDYAAFVESKRKKHHPVGFAASDINPACFEHQRMIIEWATRMGRACVFADTGLGKTIIQLEWARQVANHTLGKVLILTPLAVREQTIREAKSFGIDAGMLGSEYDIHVSNYHQLHNINPRDYSGVVLDESSIIKSYAGAIRNQIMTAFSGTHYRLACTATPAPNDFTELGNHAEFMGVCSMSEMLSEFFVHDGGSTKDWRIKGHAIAEFWRWVSSWAVLVRKPADLDINDNRYDLPPLNVDEVVVHLSEDVAETQGTLFVTDAVGLNEQRQIRRASINERCEAAASLVNNSPDKTWLIWCELNDESKLVSSMIPDAVEVTGSSSNDDKARDMLAFSAGEIRVLVTKPKIAGFGMNWQSCSNVIFIGPTHSYEQWYQSVRRCWRYGQTDSVNVYMIRTDADGHIWRNLRDKADAAEHMAETMIGLVKETQLESVVGRRPSKEYPSTIKMRIPQWL